jgi:M6 family metalloprotease-like protein
VKLTHARILVGTAAMLCLPLLVAREARAVRPTPAFRFAASQRAAPAAPVARRELNRYQRERLSASLRACVAAAPGSPDTLRVAVFQVQFTDSLMGGQSGSNRPQVRDSTWFANELAHVSQYYRGASRGRFEVRPALDGTLYTLAHRMSYYGSDANEEKRVVELAAELIALVDDDVDFSQFDLVFIIHAGAGQETDVGADSPIQIWSSFYDRGDIRRALDDDKSPGLPTNDTEGGDPYFVDNFAVVPSHASQDFATVGTLGIWAYQVGNRIGLVPLFDSTPGGAPDSQGVGGFCLMGYGLFQVNGFLPAFPCVFNRVLAGWVDPVVVDPSGTAVVTQLADVNTGSDTDTLCVKVPVTENEYFLVTNRLHDANLDSLFTFTDNDSDLIPDNTDSLEGAEFDFFLTDLTNPAVRRYDPDYGFDVLLRHTGGGVYVWHVDERVIRDAVEQGFLPDDYAARKGVDLEEADGVQDMDRAGPAAFALGSFFDSYRVGDEARSVFGPATKPSSGSNSGAPSGIEIATTSPSGPSMRVSVRRELAYSDVRVRWDAASPGQPATFVDLDDDGVREVVVLSDSAGVFVFNAGGGEWNDADSNPATIAPYIAVPGITWTGPPAFANMDASPDVEIIAAATTGELFAWKASGVELADGDANPATAGVLYDGLPMAAPPMLLDVNGGAPEVVIVEQQPASLRLSLISAAGALVIPASPLLSAQWPHDIPGQRAAPLAELHLKDGATTTIGVAAAVLDTTASRMSVTWIPAAFSGTAPASAPLTRSEGIGRVSGANAIRSLPSAPAVGDVDGDGDDEAVVTTPSGIVYVIDFASAFSPDVLVESGELRAPHPSAPALGDVDADGTLEIAVWDDSHMYLLKSNARSMLEWPREIRPASAGEAPPASAARAFEGPLVLDLDNDGDSDVLFLLDDGTLSAFGPGGRVVDGFPRVGPAEAGAAPTVGAITGASSWHLLCLGSAGVMGSVDAVIDSVGVLGRSALSIQSLALSGVNPGPKPWIMARVDLQRSGRVADTAAIQPVSGAFDQSSFIIYPNPVKEGVVHARVDTNARATVALSIYTLEGQEAIARSFSVNPNGLPNTPFDEAIDVTALKSGVYLMRLRIESSAGSGSLVKTFAIRR